jgi:hypothetical protein
MAAVITIFDPKNVQADSHRQQDDGKVLPRIC